MPRIYLADSSSEERSALRLMLVDLNMDVVGEATDWTTILTQAPFMCIDLLLVDWDLLPQDMDLALAKLRKACPNVIIIALISHYSPEILNSIPIGAHQ
jgi:DNA-binding NarL/FixJ family response regulator